MANNSVRGLNALGYVGVNAPNPANTIILNRAPTVNDYDQFNLLDTWLYSTPGTVYILTSKSGGVATWTSFGGATGAITFQTDSTPATTSGSIIKLAGDTNITTSGSGHTVTFALSNNLSLNNLTLTGFLTVGGAVTLSVLGSGVVQSNSSGVLSSSQGTDGQLLIGSSVGAPAWRNITSTGGSVSITNGHNSINLEAGGATALMFAGDSGTATPSANVITIAGGDNIVTSASGSTVTVAINGPVAVDDGGTGVDGTAFNTDGVLYYDGTVFQTTARGDTGQVLTGVHLGAPIWAAASTGISWIDQTTSTTMAINTGYIANSGSLVTLTLPATAAEGSIVRIAGKGTGGWAIAQAAGQTIHFGSSNTTTGAGGSLASTNRYDAIELLCITANTDYSVLSVQGNITIV